MSTFTQQVRAGLVTEEFASEVERFWIRKSRILVLVDGRLRVQPSPLPEIGMEFVPSDAFGISAAIGQLRNFSCGFSSFDVTVATRDGDGSPLPGHDITGLRFTDDLLKRFDQVWMFGIWPDPDVDVFDPALDATIDNPTFHPPSDAELAALARWMDAGGGVFATGDHFILGATMCRRVPRVGVMRRWTAADGVPSRSFSTRHETTRPFTVEQAIGAAQIDYPQELDPLPQIIEWVPFARDPVLPIARPHPLLCHPDRGPINILPDHMHEGRCEDFDDVGWITAKRDLGFDFAGYANQHFPTAGTARPLPQVVAWGTALADPPLNFKAGDQPLRRFPQIAAYDGQAIGIGRVVTDSTWHHWFDMNVKGMVEHTNQTGDRAVIDKIFRYWINVGIYLASSAWRAGMMLGWLKAEQFNYFGRQSITLGDPARELGRSALSRLQSAIGTCWVSEIATELIDGGRMWPMLRKSPGPRGGSRRGVAFEDIEAPVIGEIIRAAYSDGDVLKRQIAAKGVVEKSPLFGTLYKAAAEGAKRGFKAALDTQREELKAASAALEAIEKRAEPESKKRSPK